METTVIKRSINVEGRRSSVSLEDEFWTAVKEIARLKGITMTKLVRQIETGRKDGDNLSSAIRLFVLRYYMAPAPIRKAAMEAEAGAEVDG